MTVRKWKAASIAALRIHPSGYFGGDLSMHCVRDTGNGESIDSRPGYLGRSTGAAGISLK